MSSVSQTLKTCLYKKSTQYVHPSQPYLLFLSTIRRDYFVESVVHIRAFTIEKKKTISRTKGKLLKKINLDFL